MKECPKCEGDGEYRNTMLHLRECEKCNGTGEIPEDLDDKNGDTE